MPVIGLNLGKSSFRAVELEKKRDKIILNNFGIYQNPRLNLDTESKEDEDLFANALKEFIDEVGFSTSQVITGLNESHVFMRIIELPMMSDKELKNSIKYEAEQYIPLPLDKVNLSFQKLDPEFTKKNKVSVQIVAAKKDILEKYVKIIRKAKLVPKAIEPETMALGRVLGDTKKAAVGTLILEMGYSSSIIVITYGGFVRFTRNIPIGGNVLTRAIQQGLGLDQDQAEEYKKAYGMDVNQVDGKVYEMLKPIIDGLILEVKRANVFFTNHNPSANIKRVIIAGGAALMPSLLSYIADNLDIETQLANPIKNIELSSKVKSHKDTLIAQAPQYATAIGLALRGMYG